MNERKRYFDDSDFSYDPLKHMPQNISEDQILNGVSVLGAR